MKRHKRRKEVKEEKQKITKNNFTNNIADNKVRDMLANICMVLLVILSVILIINIRRTYALFESQISGTTDMDIAGWKIEVNNTNVTSGKTQSFELANFKMQEKNTVLPGKIAPGITAESTIEIVPTDLDVSTQYIIELDASHLEENITVSINSNLAAGRKLEKLDEHKYRAFININDLTGNYRDILTITLNWINDEARNETDTVLGTGDLAQLSVPININFKQYTGE